jgi:hypothetical protein
MASQFGLQYRPPFLCFLAIPHVHKPDVHLFAFGTEFLLAGLSANLEHSLATFVAIMGKAKKVKGVGLAALSVCVFSFVSAETYCAGLFRMQFKVEVSKSLPQCTLYVLGIICILHLADEIICVSHQMSLPFDVWLYFLLKPQIKHIVQEYIGEYGT